jgi:hypothetical protein
MMKNKKLGLVALVISALMISSVAAFEILGWTNVTHTDYSVKKTEATWEAWGSSWSSPPLFLSLGLLNGAETGYAIGTIRLTVTTYATVSVTFTIGTESDLSGLKSWIVRITRIGAGSLTDLVSTYPEMVTDTPSGSLTYEYQIEVWGTAKDYMPAAVTDAFINLNAYVQTPQ